jgi:hypothetical protein
MKAILWPTGEFRMLVSDDTPTDAGRTREWVPTDPPEANDGFQVVEGPPDVTETQVLQTWQQVALPLVPVTKLTIKRRVTPTEWATLKAAIAQADADTQEDWNEATEIEPANPKTAAMIEQLTSAGLLTTPLHVIFAP